MAAYPSREQKLYRVCEGKTVHAIWFICQWVYSGQHVAGIQVIEYIKNIQKGTSARHDTSEI